MVPGAGVNQISLWAALTPAGLRRCAPRSKCNAFCEPHRFKSKDRSFRLIWTGILITRILMVPGASIIALYRHYTHYQT